MIYIKIFLLCALLISCQKGQNTNDKKGSKTFVYCSEGSPSAFNPQITTDGTSNNAATYPLYNRLVEFAPGKTELISGLAEKWSITEDGLNYTFFLRPKVKFHETDYFKPTRDFNADDVIFSFERQLKKDHPYHNINGGTYEYWNSMEMSELIAKIEKVNDLTVKITLRKQDAPFLANLAMGFTSILSAEYADQLMKAQTPELIDQQAIGTGPFILQHYVKDSVIRYKRNPFYFMGPAKIDHLVFSITPDAHVRGQKLKTGECHLIIEPLPTDLPDLKAQPQLKIMSGAGLNVGYLAMNTKVKPLDNVRVREAIAIALNRPEYIKAIYQGEAVLANSPLPPTMWGHHSNLQPLKYDPILAKKYLEDLQREGVITLPLKLNLWSLPVTRPYNPNGKKMAELMQFDLKQIGIEITVQTYDWPTYLAKSRKGEHQLIQMGWTGDNGDPDNFLYNLLSCTGVNSGANLASWCDDEFHKAVTQAKSIVDQGERTKLYLKAQERFRMQLPWVPIAHSIVYRAMSNKVQGYVMDPLGSDQFDRVDLSE